MTQLFRVHAHGGPDVLQWETESLREPAPHEVRVRHTAIGVNFVDTYYRSGLYKPASLPFTPGVEAAGIIEAVGSDVTHLQPGDRVAYATSPLGAYATERNVPASCLVPAPSTLADTTVASILLKGMTAEFLLHRTVEVTSKTTLLYHAAAGGVGSIAVPWALHLGATVIATVGSEAKAQIVRSWGVEHVLVDPTDRLDERVKAITEGRGVDVVYDSIGRDTFDASLRCLRPRGLMVSFGQASGPIAPLEVARLGQLGSLYLTRPSLFAYCASRSDLLLSAQRLFQAVEQRHVPIAEPKCFPLSQAAHAHTQLESRATTGSVVLLPTS